MPVHSNHLDDDHDTGTDEDEFASDAEAEDSDIVTLLDAAGHEQNFLFLAVIDVEGEGQFAALTPADEDEEAENTEVFLFHYEADEDGGETFTPIDDEELFAKVRAAAEAYFAEQEAEETSAEDPAADEAADQAELASIQDIVSATGPEVDIVLPTEEVSL